MTAPVPPAAVLASLPRMTPARLLRLLERWPDPADALAAVRAGRAATVLTGNETRAAVAREWARAVEPTEAAVAPVLARRGTRVLHAGGAGYPIDEGIEDRPGVLFVEGDLAVLDRPRVAVVGTRAATPHGRADARDLGAALARAGVVVVSGLAIGIDAAVHEGALDAGGGVIGVVATGLDVVYPRRHGRLYARVREHGVIVSESPFGTAPHPARFPVRNRIIAALAEVPLGACSGLPGVRRGVLGSPQDPLELVLQLPGLLLDLRRTLAYAPPIVLRPPRHADPAFPASALVPIKTLGTRCDRGNGPARPGRHTPPNWRVPRRPALAANVHDPRYARFLSPSAVFTRVVNRASINRVCRIGRGCAAFFRHGDATFPRSHAGRACCGCCWCGRRPLRRRIHLPESSERCRFPPPAESGQSRGGDVTDQVVVVVVLGMCLAFALVAIMLSPWALFGIPAVLAASAVVIKAARPKPGTGPRP